MNRPLRVHSGVCPGTPAHPCAAPQILKGKHLRVNSAVQSKAPDYKRSVFLGNLPYDVKEEEVRYTRRWHRLGLLAVGRWTHNTTVGWRGGLLPFVFAVSDLVTVCTAADQRRV